MKLSELLDKRILVHGLSLGLSVGELNMVWLAHILSPVDQRMSHVQGGCCLSSFLDPVSLGVGYVLRFSHEHDYRF